MRRHDGENYVRLGKSLASSKARDKIRKAIDQGMLSTKSIILGTGKRLDHIAWQHYGDPSWWWVIAAASGIGWGLQLPMGTRVVIPIGKEKIRAIIS